jgi:hypothetical protein
MIELDHKPALLVCSPYSAGYIDNQQGSFCNDCIICIMDINKVELYQRCKC